MDNSRTVCFHIMDAATDAPARRPPELTIWIDEAEDAHWHSSGERCEMQPTEYYMLGPDAEVEVENFQAHDGDLIDFFVRGELVKTVRLPSRACTAPAAPMMAGGPLPMPGAPCQCGRALGELDRFAARPPKPAVSLVSVLHLRVQLARSTPAVRVQTTASRFENYARRLPRPPPPRPRPPAPAIRPLIPFGNCRKHPFSRRPQSPSPLGASRAQRALSSGVLIFGQR